MTTEKKKRASGPSGLHRQPRITLRATHEEFLAWQAEADKLDLHLNQWIRDVCNQHADWEPPKRKAKR